MAAVARCTLGGNGDGSAAEDYPRLTPWYLVEAGEDATTVRIEAISGACVDIDGREVGFEPLERVDVEETTQRVAISAWLGEPETPRPTECAGVGYDIPAEVELSAPLGARELVDPACDLPRYRQHAGCGEEH